MSLLGNAELLREGAWVSEEWVDTVVRALPLPLTHCSEL